MPKAEILHSGQYWADLRRRRELWAARRRRAPNGGIPLDAPEIGTVTVFCPPKPVPRPPTHPVSNTNSLQAARERGTRDDEILLARLTARNRETEAGGSQGAQQGQRKAASPKKAYKK